MPLGLPAVFRAVAAAAEDEHHRVLSLKFGELPPLRGVVGKLVVGKDRPRNDVGSHLAPPFVSPPRAAQPGARGWSSPKIVGMSSQTVG